jgi:hypothetical protein
MIVYVPGVVVDNVEIVRIAVADPPADNGTPLLLRVAVGELAVLGLTVSESVTVPVNPFRLVSEIVELELLPCWTLIDDGLADIEKSGTTFTEMVRVVVCEMDPPVPVSVTV